MDHCKSNQAGDWSRAGHSTANSALLLYFITKDLLVQLLCHQKLREGSICKLLDFYIYEQQELPRLQTGLQSSVKQRSVNIMLFLSDIWNPILLVHVLQMNIHIYPSHLDIHIHGSHIYIHDLYNWSLFTFIFMSFVFKFTTIHQNHIHIHDIFMISLFIFM